MDGLRDDPWGFSLRAYSELKESLEKNKREFAGKHPRELFERLLSFQESVNNKILGLHLSKDERMRQDASDDVMMENYSLSLSIHNIRYLLLARDALEQNLTSACESLMRPVAESIPKLVYIIACPHTVINFILIEKYPAWKSKNAAKDNNPIEKFLQSPQQQKLLNGRQMTSKRFTDFRKQHRSTEIRKLIYDSETLELQNKLHSSLNIGSHANSRRPSPRQYDPGVYERSAGIADGLSFFNLFVMLNSQSKSLKELQLVDASKRFIEKAKQELGQWYTITNMYPKAEYREKLWIKL